MFSRTSMILELTWVCRHPSINVIGKELKRIRITCPNVFYERRYLGPPHLKSSFSVTGASLKALSDNGKGQNWTGKNRPCS